MGWHLDVRVDVRFECALPEFFLFFLASELFGKSLPSSVLASLPPVQTIVDGLFHLRVIEGRRFIIRLCESWLVVGRGPRADKLGSEGALPLLIPNSLKSLVVKPKLLLLLTFHHQIYSLLQGHAYVFSERVPLFAEKSTLVLVEGLFFTQEEFADWVRLEVSTTQDVVFFDIEMALVSP